MNRLRALGYASLILGGCIILAYAAFGYFAIWRHEFFFLAPDREGMFVIPANISIAQNGTEEIVMPMDDGRPRFRANLSIDPLSQVLSPQAVFLLMIGAFFVFNGVTLIQYTNHKERKETKKFLLSTLLSDEEKAVYDELLKNNGEATQKHLATATGFSAVKAHRVISRLEAKKVVQSFPFGMTKKVVLKEAD